MTGMAYCVRELPRYLEVSTASGIDGLRFKNWFPVGDIRAKAYAATCGIAADITTRRDMPGGERPEKRQNSSQPCKNGCHPALQSETAPGRTRKCRSGDLYGAGLNRQLSFAAPCADHQAEDAQTYEPEHGE